MWFPWIDMLSIDWSIDWYMSLFFDVSSNNKTSLSRSESDAFIHHTTHTQWRFCSIRYPLSLLSSFSFPFPFAAHIEKKKMNRFTEDKSIAWNRQRMFFDQMAWWEYQRKEAKRASSTNQTLFSLISLEIWREQHTNASSWDLTVKCRDSSIHLHTWKQNSEWELSWSAGLDLTCTTDDEMKFLSHSFVRSFIHSLSVKISDVHLLPVLFGTRVNQTRASNTQPSIPHL